MSLNLLKQKTDIEGFLKKTASAKGEDKVRGNWQERWFHLYKHELKYFKKKGDSEAKGLIDLRYAKVDPAEDKTGLPFTIRVAQSKQVFNYLRCSSEVEYERWLAAVRKGAGYMTEESISKDFPKTQAHGYASFGALQQRSATDQTLRGVVVILDTGDNKVKFFEDGLLVRQHDFTSIATVSPTDTPAALSPITTRRDLYGVKIDFKGNSYMSEKLLYVGSKAEATHVTTELIQAGTSKLHELRRLLTTPPVLTGYVLVEGEGVTQWEDAYVVIVSKRVIIYGSHDAKVPSRVVYLRQNSVNDVDRTTLSVHSPSMKLAIQLKSEGERIEWKEALRTASAASALDDVAAPVLSPAGVVSASPSQASFASTDEKKEDAAAPPPPFTSYSSNVTAPSTTTTSSSSSSLLGDSTAPTASSANTDIIIPQLRKDGSPSYLVSWGDGSSGQLGHRVKESVDDPNVIEALSTKNVRAISSGRSHVAAITEEGHVYVWGDGSSYQLGLGENRTQSSSPYLVTSLRLTPIVSISCGSEHTVAVTAQGGLYVWGSNKKGQLGIGQDKGHAAYPVEVTGLPNPILSAVAGDEFTLLVTSVGEVLVFGDNSSGQLGLGDLTPRYVPTLNALLSALRIQSASAGSDFSAFLSDKGGVWTCGNANFGKLGHGNTTSVSTPKEIVVFRTNNISIQQVALGENHAVACDASGMIYTWGAAVANGMSKPMKRPSRLAQFVGKLSLSASSSHTFVVDGNGMAYAFGDNSHKEVGSGADSTVIGVFRVCLAEECRVMQSAPGTGFSILLCEGYPPKGSAVSHKRGSIAIATVDDPLLQALALSSEASESEVNEKIGTLLSQLHTASGGSSTTTFTAAAPVASSKADDAKLEEDGEKKKKKKKKGKWKEVVDPQSGRTYYYHTVTRETKWRKPDDME